MGRRLRPAPVLPRRAGRRGVFAPDGHAADPGLRRLPQLLPRGARPGRRDGQPAARGRVQGRGRGLHRRRSVARVPGRQPRGVRRPVGHLHPGRREGPQAAGRHHRCADRRPAAAPRRGRGRRREDGARREARRQADDPRPGARPDGRAWREVRGRQVVPPGRVRALPRAPGAEVHRRRHRRGGGRGRHRRRCGAGRRGGRALHRGPDPPGAARRQGQGRGAARELPGAARTARN